ncbi:hypothetical protein FIB82_25130 [Escherichia coli]|nr:hypothetical protein [Escherichia coli]TNM79925.1 hypothetical protein FHR03_23240 [Escherichia coli]TNP70570.1 hypothetical protein FIB37_26195 [Escherichia coli]TNR96049.1 hypothetical protein FIC33_25515 [Escherichia coli]TNS62764.1 hypothetical protein FIC16_24780 [Escherichia coli]
MTTVCSHVGTHFFKLVKVCYGAKILSTESHNSFSKSLYIDLCNCLILICSIQHQMKVNRLQALLTNWSKTSKPLKTSVN